jgi:NadR type nicotinamide-nucleotide adenylyltransferase
MPPTRNTSEEGTRDVAAIAAVPAQYTTGLVVGKFSPLHLGHELLIETATRSCRQVVIISYSKPEFQGCERAAREGWLRARFPQATVLVIDDAALHQLCSERQVASKQIPPNDAADAAHREFVAWLCDCFLHVTVDVVFTSEDYGAGFAAALSTFFTTRLGRKHRVEHVSVDPQRRRVPISGTLVREDVHQARHYVAPIVRASFVRRVCLLGGESSGKTTLAQALALFHRTAWVSEFGRERWEQRQGELTFDDLTDVAEMQIAMEDGALAEANRYVFCDTSPLTTLFYSRSMFGRASARLEALAQRPYDAVFLCSPDFPFVQDGTRRDQQFRLQQDAWYQEQLAQRRIAFSRLSGSLGQRIETASEILLAKFQNHLSI